MYLYGSIKTENAILHSLERKPQQFIEILIEITLMINKNNRSKYGLSNNG